jgi:adenine phosphoribosyltransferase
MLPGLLAGMVRDIADFPKPGITFKDITPLLGDPDGLASAVDALAAPHRGVGINKVVGIEARGFILAAPVALALGAGFVPVRKAGKLPSDIHRQEYQLEYGTDLIEIHRDALEATDRVLILDDVLATGGTAAATVQLVGQSGAEVVGLSFLIELGFLSGRSALAGQLVTSVLSFD